MTSSLHWLVVPLVLLSLLGVTVNAYILLVVLFSRQASSANNLLLLHLGALDVLLGILFLVFSAPGLTRPTWLSTGAPCNIHGFLFTLLHSLVLWTICGLNADRYYAIAAPLHYGHLVNPKKVLACLGIGWLLSLALSIPPFFSIAPFKFNLGLGACIPDFDSEKDTLWYSAAYTAFTLLLPVTLIICCNAKVLMIARYHRHRIASAIYEVTLSAQVTITHQRNPFFVPTVTAPGAGGPKFRSRSPVSSVLQLLGSALVLYLPYYGVILYESSMNFLLKTHPLPIDPLIYHVVLSVLTISPLINGFLYGLKNKMLRKTFQNYWRKKLTKNEVNHEIQARTPSTCGSRRQSLTPLGFFTRPTLPRRLSEALLDIHRTGNSPGKPPIKRIASEISWRPNSTGVLNFLTSEERQKIPQTNSCNTLQVPKADVEDVKDAEDVGSKPPTRNLSAANLLLQKFFGLDDKKPEVVGRRSPKILITRALSEDSDKTHSRPQTPTKDLSRRHSSSVTNLLEKKWRQMKYKEPDYDSDGPNSKTKLLERSSDSSETSETSSGLYVNLDRVHSCNILGTKEGTRAANFIEEQALLSWPTDGDPEEVFAHRFNGPSREIVL